MKLAKRIMAATLALTMTAGLFACGDNEDTSSDASSVAPGVDLNADQQAMVDAYADDSRLADVELENKTITWMAHYDINPTEGKVKSPAMQLFETKYGGTIEWHQTTWENRYTDLASAVLSNESPDFFPADDGDAFPRGAISPMFQPIDDIIDLDSELWAGSKELCDQFVFRDSHYVAAIEATPTYACVYNKTTIEANGFEDPAELYWAGEWDWDVFTDMCIEFTDSEQDMYALDGYWYTNALSETSGVPLIGLEDGVIVQNMSDPAIERVQERMYDLQLNGVVFPRATNNWDTRGDGANGEGLGSYLTLFIPIGLYALECPPESREPFGPTEEVMFVPMPKEPDSDITYASARVHGYLICAGAPNPEGVAAYLNCEQVTNQAEDLQQIETDTLKNEYEWTDEMIEMREELYRLAAEYPVFDFMYGVSDDLKKQMESVSQATMISGGNATTWGAARAEYESTIQYLVDEANESSGALEDVR